MPRFINLKGMRFGRLRILERAPSKHGVTRWYCACDCGTLRVISSPGFKNWKTQSCGCLQREATSQAARTHGLSKSPTYKVWCAMKSRCFRKTDTAYADYGGRGITVCPEWAASFEAFLRDMGERPAGMTIERRDATGHYEPGNCVWASRLDQARNRRSLHMVNVDGEEMCLSAACALYGQKRKRVQLRLAGGWDLMEALTTPSLGSGKSRKDHLKLATARP